MSEQIQQMQRLQLAGTLASGIAHDLNNELTLVLGNIDFALDHLPQGYTASDSLELAKTAAGRCADMSRRLLHMSRAPRKGMVRMDVASAVCEARQMLECIKPANTRVTTECETGLFIQGDPSDIQQALINLGTNAFQAMAKGGDVQIRAYRDEEHVKISVHDTGHGIPKSLRQRIFEPFFTTHAATGGSGLGLPTVRTIVASHNGAIGLESTPGEGATFLLTFPALVE